MLEHVKFVNPIGFTLVWPGCLITKVSRKKGTQSPKGIFSFGVSKTFKANMWSRVVGSIVFVLACYVIWLFHEMCPPEDLQTHLQQRSCVPANLPLKKDGKTILPFWVVAYFQGII